MDLVYAALAQRGGAVRVDRDAYKAVHPSYSGFLVEDVRTAGVRVRTDTYGWQARVEERLRASRFDAVVEAPLGRPEEFLAEIAAYRRAGYRIEIVALAVPGALSQLGVLDRYLRLALEGRARYVGWDNHDACAAALPAALAEVEAGHLADRVFVVRRSTDTLLETVYANRLDPDGRWVSPARAAQAVVAERTRSWDAVETGRFRRQLAASERRVNDPRIGATSRRCTAAGPPAGSGRGRERRRWPYSRSRRVPTPSRRRPRSGPSSGACTRRCRSTATTWSPSARWPCHSCRISCSRAGWRGLRRWLRCPSRPGDDGTIRVVEVDEDTTAYDRDHSPGAVGWDWTTDLHSQVDRDGVQHLLRAVGVEDDTTVVLYGGNNNWFAAYAYWLLRLRGYGPVRLLDGGRKKCELEGRELTHEVMDYQHTTYRLTGPERPELRALRDEVLARAQVFAKPGADAVLVDVRSPAEFRGDLIAPAHLPQEQAQVPGHIPGAVNVPWSQAANDDGSFRSAQELRALYGGPGVEPEREVIAYCRIGERSAHTWFALTELLGYPHVKNYDGSWTEYGSLVRAPVALGA